MKEYAFGIDLGGTTAKVGLFTTSGALLEKWEVPTDTSNAGEHILENLADAIHAKMAEKEITSEQVEGVGIGVPGPVLDSRVVPIICANLGGWGERNVSAQLSGPAFYDSAGFFVLRGPARHAKGASHPGCGSQRLLRSRLHPAGRCPNNSSLLPPLAAVVVVAPIRGAGCEAD